MKVAVRTDDAIAKGLGKWRVRSGLRYLRRHPNEKALSLVNRRLGTDIDPEDTGSFVRAVPDLASRVPSKRVRADARKVRKALRVRDDVYGFEERAENRVE